MMEALEARGRRAAEARTAQAAERVAARLGAEVPGTTVEVEPGRVAISGRGLVRRMRTEPALRWIGGVLR